MRIVAQFDPSTETSQIFNAGFANGHGRIVVYNESNVNLQLSWGSFTTYCPAWTAMLYCISHNNANITWSSVATLNSASPPVSLVIVEAYEDSEAIVGTYPAALVRQTNVGNPVSVNGGSVTAVTNDGNAAGTQFVEATVGTDSQPGVTLTNDGVLVLGNGLGRTGKIFLSDVSGNATLVVEGSGNFANGGLLINGTTGQIQAAGGIVLTGGVLQLLTGSISRISKFSGGSVQGKVTVNHGLGVVPDLVLVTFNLSSTPVAATIGPNYATLTSTTVDIWASVAANFVGVAIKF
jgi:hypothetical protein